MDNLNLVGKLPPMLTGQELEQALTILPEYDPGIKNESTAARLIALSEMYKVFVPTQMSKEIYAKMYLALLRSLQKKESKLAIRQYTENHRATRQQEYSGILGGSDSFTIIGASGIGKSSSITRTVQLLTSEEISTTSKESPSLTHAELEIPESSTPTFSQNPLEQQVAAYVSEVFSVDIAMDNPVTIGTFMHHRLEYSKYLSLRGQKRNLALLTDDFNAFYHTLPHPTLAEHWQLEKIFSNYRCHTYDICLLALFLGVPVTELVDMKLPEKSQAQLFDEEIIWLHNNGLNYRQISQKIGASYLKMREMN